MERTASCTAQMPAANTGTETANAPISSDDFYTAGVYILSEGKQGPCKIGVTTARNDRARFISLQTGNPRELFPEYMFPTDRSYEIERLAHERLWPKRIRGEWFNVTVEEANKVIDNIYRGIHGQDSLPPYDTFRLADDTAA
jgi:hypothetical protein